MLISEALNKAANKLKEKGVDSNRIDAFLILGHALGLNREQIMLNQHLSLNKQQEEKFLALLARREKYEPVSHIIGKREFYSNEFVVSSDVLDPRPDSESLIDLALKTFPEKNDKLRILELGVGSGCLIITLLKHLPHATGIGVDINEASLSIAKRNAISLKVDNRIELIKSDWFKNIADKAADKFDLIISNPPYIKTNDIQNLQNEVKRFEPIMALDGGNDGLDCYKEIAKDAGNFLKESGFLILEIGQDQEKDVIKIFEDSGLKFVEDIKDLGGIIRCLLFSKSLVS